MVRYVSPVRLLAEREVICARPDRASLGEGAFAEVYRVKDRFLGRQIMKQAPFTSDPAISAREGEESNPRKRETSAVQVAAAEFGSRLLPRSGLVVEHL